MTDGTDVASSRGGWTRRALLLLGCVLSAVAGYATAQLVYVVAVVVDAAPLLAGDSTPEQPWVAPAAVVLGVVVLVLGLRWTVRSSRRRR